MPAVQTVVEVAIEAKLASDTTRLRKIVDHIVENDTFAAAAHDDESGQTVLRTTDEMHLDFLTADLIGQVGKDIMIGAPQVSYRETFAGTVETDYTHKRQMASNGQFARVIIRVEPGSRGDGVRFANVATAENVPARYIPAIEQGVNDTATGLLVGFPMIDTNVTLLDGAYHDIDSSTLAFRLAARGALREAAHKAGVQILEPIMKIAILTRMQWLHPIKENLARRHATIEETGDRAVVIATASMANLFGVQKDMKALANGEVAVTMLLNRYAPVPTNHTGPDDTVPSAAALSLPG